MKRKWRGTLKKQLIFKHTMGLRKLIKLKKRQKEEYEMNTHHKKTYCYRSLMLKDKFKKQRMRINVVLAVLIKIKHF